MAREEPILLKKLAKVDAQWGTKDTLLGWAVRTAQQILTLPTTWQEKLTEDLAAISSRVARVFKNKWYRLLGILCIVVPSIEGAEVMSRRLQDVPKAADTRWVKLTSHVHDELNIWRYFMDSLEA